MSSLHIAFASQPNTLAGLCLVVSSSILIVNSGLSSEIQSCSSLVVRGEEEDFQRGKREGWRECLRLNHPFSYLTG